jgi:nicotinamide-nucleotide amidase
MIEIICIGDELLIGQVVNTNASWMAQQLNDAGFEVRQITCVSDNGLEISRALKEASERAEVILMTGGLGPTKDDITRDVLCKFFSTHLILNEAVLEKIQSFFIRRKLPLTQINQDQAMVPANALIVENQLGTAPGLVWEKNNQVFVAMPGVPFEMQHIMDSWVIPYLQKKGGRQVIIHKTIHTSGIGESFLSEIIADWENSLAPHIKLAYLPSPGTVRLRLTAHGNDKAFLEKLIHEKVEALNKLIYAYKWGEDDQTLESVIGEMIRNQGMKLATAESCTGGYIAHRITSVAGSSDYFKGSVIAYDNAVKVNVLGVKTETLEPYGAVSSQVVEEMALGVSKLLSADYAIAVSGIAGPGGGTSEKPVGTVWVAVASANKVTSKKFIFGHDRQRNIVCASFAALALLKEHIREVSSAQGYEI